MTEKERDIIESWLKERIEATITSLTSTMDKYTPNDNRFIEYQYQKLKSFNTVSWDLETQYGSNGVKTSEENNE